MQVVLPPSEKTLWTLFSAGYHDAERCIRKWKSPLLRELASAFARLTALPGFADAKLPPDSYQGSLSVAQRLIDPATGAITIARLHLISTHRPQAAFLKAHFAARLRRRLLATAPTSRFARVRLLAHQGRGGAALFTAYNIPKPCA